MNHHTSSLSDAFWKTKPLSDLSQQEWESLCDGCGRCCLNKLRDEDTEAIVWTDISCRLLNTETCQCSDYKHRQRRVPDCVKLTPDMLDEIDWLPPSCAYRLIKEGADLPSWHPLISGTKESVKTAGASVAHKCINERYAGDYEDHLVDWPGEWPKADPAAYIDTILSR